MTPPLAVPSSLVRARALTSVAAVNWRACSMAFWPVLASRTRSTSWGASGMSFCMTFLILPSSFMSPTLLWRRPAVSMMTTSACLEMADWRVS